MKNGIKLLGVVVVVCSVVSLLAQAPTPRGQRAGVELKWPPGYIEPNTPNMKYVTPETPQGTGPYKAVMATDPTDASAARRPSASRSTRARPSA